MIRTPIPNRRPSEVITFEHNGISYKGSVSYLIENGVIGAPIEVFLEGATVGSSVQAVARDCAVAASIALQFGMPLATLRDALTRNDDGSPAGPLGALLDLIEPSVRVAQDGGVA